MAYTNSPYPYVRAVPPAQPESQQKYLQDELKKIERVLQVVYECLKQLEKAT